MGCTGELPDFAGTTEEAYLQLVLLFILAEKTSTSALIQELIRVAFEKLIQRDEKPPIDVVNRAFGGLPENHICCWLIVHIYAWRMWPNTDDLLNLANDILKKAPALFQAQVLAEALRRCLDDMSCNPSYHGFNADEYQLSDAAANAVRQESFARALAKLEGTVGPALIGETFALTKRLKRQWPDMVNLPQLAHILLQNAPQSVPAEVLAEALRRVPGPTSYNPLHYGPDAYLQQFSDDPVKAERQGEFIGAIVNLSKDNVEKLLTEAHPALIWDMLALATRLEKQTLTPQASRWLAPTLQAALDGRRQRNRPRERRAGSNRSPIGRKK